MSAPRGVFITFEGGEGAGKSTQARRLFEALKKEYFGREVVLTREPGGTAGAEALRAVLLDPNTMLTPLADTLTHFAARAEHVEQVVRPALQRGAIVICDRFYDSTTAYQGYGMGVPFDHIQTLIQMIGLKPDLTFILEVPDFISKQRLQQRGATADRYERMQDVMMARIAQGFREIAITEPERCQLVDASQDPDTVFDAIQEAVKAKFGLL